MIVSPHTNHVVWLDGNFVTWEQANIPLVANHYGFGVFEGVRAYATEYGASIFRLEDHTTRLFQSAHILNINIPYSPTELNLAQCDLLKINNLRSAYLRPFVFSDGITGLSLHTQSLQTRVAIIALAWEEKGAYLNQQHVSLGLKLSTSSLTRSNNSHFLKAKANGNYLNSILALQEAQIKGANEALLLDPQGNVAETSGANIFIVRHNILYTPETTQALDGITRKTIFTLAADLNLKVIEKRMTRDEIYIADEVFLTGTAAEITPVRELDGRIIAKGQRGPITAKLQDLYYQVTHHLNPKYQSWLTSIEFKENAHVS